MNEISQLVRQHLINLKPYSSARDEYEGTSGVFLDANENSLGTVGVVHSNRYPDPYQRKLKKRISEIKGVDPSNIYLGNGSDEPIDLIIRAFCEPGQDKIAYFVPTYGMYRVSADIHNVESVELPLTDQFEIDLDECDAVDKSNLKVTFICSPNNPTGNLLGKDAINRLLVSLPGIVVIDEAYIDFADDDGYLQYLTRHPRLVILQTLSKAWGLAAYRIGMAFASTDILYYLNKIKPPYNLSGPIQQMVLEALDKQSMVTDWVDVIKEERIQLADVIKQLPNVKKVYPSDTNFLLVRFEDSDSVFRFLIDRKIIIRDRSSAPGCDNCLRVTVGTPAENEKLVKALNDFLT